MVVVWMGYEDPRYCGEGFGTMVVKLIVHPLVVGGRASVVVRGWGACAVVAFFPSQASHSAGVVGAQAPAPLHQSPLGRREQMLWHTLDCPRAEQHE